jgi:flagellar M-ring protein FliF
MKFADGNEGTLEEATKAEQSWMPKMDLTRIIELTVLAVVGILILLMIVRPLMIRMVEFSGVAEGDAEAAALLAVAQGQNNLMALPATGMSASVAEGDQYTPDSSDDMLINLENVEGRVKASSVKKIAEIIDKHPEEAVTILRNWMYEEPWKQEKIT